VLIACIVLSLRLLYSLSLSFLTHARIYFALFVLYATLHYRYEYYSSFNCRWCPNYMDVAESAAILGNSQTIADWEKAFYDQVIGSGLFPGVTGCRILTEMTASATATAQSA
jgi:hypothetical protein